MPFDRFLIAPFDASSDILKNIYGGRMVNKRKAVRKDVKDMVGQVFGDLTVISAAGPGKYRGMMWNCVCACGNKCLAYGGHLRDSTRKSCGCLSKSRIFETGINRVFSSYKAMAARRGWEFSITREHLEKLVLSNCNYCGREPHNELKTLKTKKLQIKYNGIDRFDSSLGYTNENCVPCCYYCNHSKLDLTLEQWLEHIKKIVKHQGISDGI